MLTLIRAENNLDTVGINKFCYDENIEIIFSRPYQKVKTHRVERSHRTVQEIVVKVINERTHIDSRFWAYVHIAANTLIH